MKKFAPYLTPFGLAIMPIIASAQTVESAIATIENILNLLIQLLMVLATVVFLWGVITNITGGGEEEKIKKGKSYMLFGIIGLFVMVAIGGILKSPMIPNNI